MNSFKLSSGALAWLVLAGAAQAHDADGKLGKVSFPTSCDAKVQAEFETGVAMLHSYWFGTAGKTFRSVLEKYPSCVMAHCLPSLAYRTCACRFRSRSSTPRKWTRESRA